MRSGILTGSALALAILAMGSTQASACDDDCDYCGGYGYYGASYYGYYARPAYAYVPGPYYAAPAYAYYAPAYYYAPAPAYYAPQPNYYGYGRPYYGWRGGYVDAGARRNGVVPGAAPAGRGMYAQAGKPAPRTIKAPTPAHIAPAVFKAPKPNRAAPGILAAAPKPPKPALGAQGLPATVAKHGNSNSRFPVASYGPQPRYTPTAYYGVPGGYYGPPRR